MFYDKSLLISDIIFGIIIFIFLYSFWTVKTFRLTFMEFYTEPIGRFILLLIMLIIYVKLGGEYALIIAILIMIFEIELISTVKHSAKIIENGSRNMGIN